MKTTFNAQIIVAFTLFVAGCASLDERLVSPDVAVRREAYAEVLDTACKSGKWEEVAPMLDRISDQDDLEKVLYEQSHAVRLWGPRLSDEQILQIASRIKGEERFRRLVSKDCWPAVSGISNLTELERIATGSGNVKGRLLAVSKINDQGILVEIAKNGTDGSVREMAASMLTDSEKIREVAFLEPDADSALRLLERLPNRRFYNELKRQLNDAGQIVLESRLGEDMGLQEANNAGERIARKLGQSSYSFLSPWIKIATEAQLAKVRQKALGHIPADKTEIWRSIAETEVKRFLLANGTSYKYRVFEWFDNFQPLDETVVTGFINSGMAWPDGNIPSEIILWGLLVHNHNGGYLSSYNGYQIALRLIGKSNDRKLLNYLSNDHAKTYRCGVSQSRIGLKTDWRSRKVFLAERIDRVGQHESWEPDFETENPWGFVSGLQFSEKRNTDKMVLWSKIREAIARLAELDREEAAAAAARKAESDKREQERKLAAVRAEDSEESLIRTAKTASDRKLRIAAIERIKSMAALSDLAVNDADAAVRSAAIGKIDDDEVLLDSVENDFDSAVRDGAFKRLRQVFPDRCGVSFVHKLAVAKKISDTLLSSAVSSFLDSDELRGLISDAAVSVPVRNAALVRVNDEVFLKRIASSIDSPALQTAAIGKIADADFLLSMANDRTIDPSVQSAALSRLKALSQWVRIAAGLQSPSEQKEALSHIASDEERVEVVKTGNSTIVKLLAAERIASPDRKSEIESIVRESESTWSACLETMLSEIQTRINTAKRTQKTCKDMEDSFANEIGTSVEAAMGDVFGGKVWCGRWQDKARTALAETASLKNELKALDVPRSQTFDFARKSIGKMTDELNEMTAAQQKILDDVTDMKKNFDKMVEMFGPSIFL